MARGTTFSITLPKAIVESYDKLAKKLGISRSRVVGNILIDKFTEDEKSDGDKDGQDKK